MKLSEIIEKAQHMDVIRLPKHSEGRGYLVDKKTRRLLNPFSGMKLLVPSEDIFSDEWEFGFVSDGMKAWINAEIAWTNLTKQECFCLFYETAMN